MAWGAAKREAKIARALEDMPLIREALEAGDVSMSATRLLVDARDTDPEEFARSERVLVQAAYLHSVEDLRKVTAYWCQAVERAAGMQGEEKLREQRRLHVSVTFLGMVKIDGLLDPENGEALIAAIQAVVDAQARSGEMEGQARSPAQKRADALGEISRRFLDSGDRPQVAGERPHVNVLVDVETLTGEGGAVHEMDHVGPVDPELIRMTACDASVSRIVMAGRSEPLDVGRRTPVVPPPMRRAVVIRDGHCRFPVCDAPPEWCDAHQAA